jgi:hypothetical protein
MSTEIQPETQPTPEERQAQVEQLYTEHHKLPEPVESAQVRIQLWLDKTFPGEIHTVPSEEAGYYAASTRSSERSDITDYEERAQIRYYDPEKSRRKGKQKLELVIAELDKLGAIYQRLTDDFGYGYLVVEQLLP